MRRLGGTDCFNRNPLKWIFDLDCSQATVFDESLVLFRRICTIGWKKSSALLSSLAYLRYRLHVSSRTASDLNFWYILYIGIGRGVFYTPIPTHPLYVLYCTVRGKILQLGWFSLCVPYNNGHGKETKWSRERVHFSGGWIKNPELTFFSGS